MDSPLSQGPTQLHRMRTYSNLSVHSIDGHGAIRKRTPSLSRTTSTPQIERLYQLALEQSNCSDSTGVSLTSAPRWLTPHSSPQPHIFSDSNVEQFPEWGVPLTPPRSDSGLPTVSVDVNEVPVTTGLSSSTVSPFDHNSTASADMRFVSTLRPNKDNKLTRPQLTWLSLALAIRIWTD